MTKKKIMKCLLLIDIQEGFIVDETQRILSKLEKLVNSDVFDCKYQTKFKNSEDSIYVRNLHWNGLLTPEEQKCRFSLPEFVKYGYAGLTKELLQELPKEREEVTLYLCGIDTEGCVAATAIQAFDLGFNVKVVADCCASTDGDATHMAGIIVLSRLLGEDAMVQYSDLLEEKTTQEPNIIV